MIDEKVSDLPLVTVLPLDPDSFLLVSEDDGAGNLTSKKILFSDFKTSVGSLAWTPAVSLLQTGWTEIGAPDCPVAYVKNTEGKVSMRGSLNYNISAGAGFNKTILTLPVNNRPAKEMTFTVYFRLNGGGSITGFSNNYFMSVRVYPNGNVDLMQAVAGFTSVDIDLATVEFHTI